MSSESTSASARPSFAPTAWRPEGHVDRSLGAIAVPAVFRSAGYTVMTIDDVFGRRPVEDTEWIRYADERGMAVACKDDRIRTRPAEKRALYYSHLRVLCLTAGQLGRDEQAARFERNLPHIERLWRREGPWVYAVHARTVERLRLYMPD